MGKVEIHLLEFPKDLALISRKVKSLKPGEKVWVFHTQSQRDRLKKWCSETGNIFENQSPERSVVIRGKGFHGVCLNEKISFYLTGVKLHLKEYLLKFARKYPPFLFNFISTTEAQKGLELLEKLGWEFVVLPSPKEVEGYCGFAVGFRDYPSCERSFKELLNQKVGVEVIFRKGERGFEILKGAWEF